MIQIKFLKSKWLFVIFLFVTISSRSQNIKFSGVVTDSLKGKLAFATVIASPLEKGEIKFAITDEMGRFEILLEKGQSYKITASLLGFTPFDFTITPHESFQKTITLIESTEELAEVTLKYQLPIVVKEDTITYIVKSFTSGNERKLKEVLEKLPGVEVDNNGNVTSQGKPVSKVMVDNNDFFNGNTRLATNNVPADVVEKVEFIDNYNDVAFMKEIENSDILIMNLKLYQDKKKFVFGEIKSSAGYNKKYNLKPSLFYYNPKYQVNFIGDHNNLGKKEMNSTDLRNLEGNYSNFLPTSTLYRTKDESNFVNTLISQNFTTSKTSFGAVNLSHNYKNSRINLFSIWNWDKNLLLTEIDNKFLADQAYSEFKSISTNTKNNIGLSKLTFNNKIGNFENINISLSHNIITEYRLQQDTTRYATDNINYLINHESQKSQLINQFNWSKQYDSKNTLAFQNNLKYKKSLPEYFFQTNSNTFHQQIPIIPSDIYLLGTQHFINSFEWNSNIRYYYKFKKYHIFQLTLANQNVFEKYNSFEYQKLNTDTYIDLTNSGFGTKSNIQLNTSSVDFAYKLKYKKWDSNINLTYYYILYNYTEISQKKSFSKILVHPSLTIEYDLNKGYIISMRSGFRSQLPEINKLTNTYAIINQNSIYRGASDLTNDLAFNSYLYLRKSSLVHRFSFNFNMSYTKKIKSIDDYYLFNGFNRFQSTQMTDNPYESFSTGIYFNKYSKFISLNISTNYTNSSTKLNSNSTSTLLKYNLISSTVGVKSRFKKSPNVGLSYHIFTTLSPNSVLKNNYQSNNYQFVLNTQILKQFQLKSDLNINKTKNELVQNNTINYNLNTLLSYHKNNSLWYFEIEGINLMNNKFKYYNTQTDYFITSTKQYNIERSILLNIIYKY